tara:strand:+ start:167 stop:418 length:252 start_codon:yes stop_codon:yes gene_type:complete
MSKVNNGDMPAIPQNGAFSVADDFNSSEDMGGTGLSKLEHFAGLAMQGFISAGVNGMPSPDDIALLSARYAEALLAQLEKGNE